MKVSKSLCYTYICIYIFIHFSILLCLGHITYQQCLIYALCSGIIPGEHGVTMWEKEDGIWLTVCKRIYQCPFTQHCWKNISKF